MMISADIRMIYLVFSSLLLLGCSGTTVVLVPDSNGKVGHVSVTTDGGGAELNKSGESTTASKVEKAPQTPKPLNNKEIQDMFAVALANEPAPPERYHILFLFDSAELLPHSKRTVQDVYQAIQSRQSCDLSVIGHTDLAGTDEYNQNLSKQRAKAVFQKLNAMGVAKECMDLRYYGERDPIVSTPNGVAEPRNRRVDVEIR
jgi:outer membrane protein OmpA-like peptidoglycan-associated protein